MPDHAAAALPRIALVFGDEAMVAHVREAVLDHVEIVYAASAGEFDASRLAATRAAAALVNLDDGDWLGAVEAKLHAAGVAVVYNDPEISRQLEGWARARWLRHLVAKLRGSRDVDPPRPETPRLCAPALKAQTVAPAQEGFAPPVESVVIERPLSPEEIETMTVDFVAEQKTAATPVVGTIPHAAMDIAVDASVVSLEVSEQSSTLAEPPLAFEPTLEFSDEPAFAADAQAEVIASQAGMEPAVLDFDADTALDVDTEALSAMIDARLAEPNASEPSGSPEVWREVSGDPVPPHDVEVAAKEEAQPHVAPVSVPAAAVNDDADVFASLPALDDWQLVDPEIPVTPVANKQRKIPELALSDTFAGLELVPMETVASVPVQVDPIERWMDDGKVVKPEREQGGLARVGASGGEP